MGVIGKDFKFKIIKNFLSQDEIDLLSIYCEVKHRTNQKYFDTKMNNNADTYFYGDPTTDSLLIKKKNLMEKETGKKLLGTYSYWRCYTKNAILKKHKDRPSCEISVTVHINNDEQNNKWPIYMEGTPLYLEKGDAAIYLGCEIEHWRDELKGDYQFQAFLHYVDAEGKNKNYYMDKRAYWGLPK